jgi:hypothetical protein
MTDSLIDSVPADRREAARLALASAFGRAPLTRLQPVSGGASGALIYRAEVAGRPYLLRLEKTERVGFHDPVRSFACMRIAAEAGVAPPTHFADPATGAAIMAFVPQRPILEYPGGCEPLARALGALLARLQRAPAFPPITPYPDIIGFLLLQLRNSNLFAPGALAAHSEGFARIRAVYRWDPGSLVPSHNDPNRGNILFDGERLWLIDWESAFCNDPLVDITIVANYLASPAELEDALLQSWLGRAPDRLTRARLTLMRQFTRLFYGTMMLSSAAATPRGAPETLDAPTLAEFGIALTEGRFAIGTPETMHVFGKAFLREFLAGLSAPGFDEALTVARQG